jgi:hypothetical protein
VHTLGLSLWLARACNTLSLSLCLYLCVHPLRRSEREGELKRERGRDKERERGRYKDREGEIKRERDKEREGEIKRERER